VSRVFVPQEIKRQKVSNDKLTFKLQIYSRIITIFTMMNLHNISCVSDEMRS